MRRFPIVILAATVLLFFNACEEGTIPRPPPSDIIFVIESIEHSFNIRNIDDLEYWIHSDFTFYFDPKDVGEEAGDYIIPESWPREEFLSAVENMFDLAYSIDISIDTLEVDDPVTNDEKYIAADVPVRFLIMVDPVSGFLARGTFDFEFRAEYNEKNGKEWFATTWRDFTSPSESGGRNAGEASFGEILVRYHKP